MLEQFVYNKRLGRYVDHDIRSRTFQAEQAAQVSDVAHAAIGLPLDQGNIGSCTANALCGAGNANPNRVALRYGPFTERGAVNLYRRETADEGQPYPPNDPGGSGLAVCKAAREFGWIKSYQHALGVQQALRALVLRPVITGVDWYDSFDEPDSNGLVEIAPDAQVRGGHEFVALRVLAQEQLVGFVNSWGSSFGVADEKMGVPGGAFYMSFSTWDTLLRNQGDVTVPIFV